MEEGKTSLNDRLGRDTVEMIQCGQIQLATNIFKEYSALCWITPIKRNKQTMRLVKIPIKIRIEILLDSIGNE